MSERDALLTKKIEVDAELASLSMAIREMVADAKNKQRFAPVKQYNDLFAKQARLKKESQTLQMKIGSMGKEERKKEHLERISTINELFIAIAKNSLPTTQFREFMDKAYSLYDSGGRNE